MPLSAFSLIPQSPLLFLATMEFKLKAPRQSSRAESSESAVPTIYFTYRLIPGVTDKSYSLHCARIAGIPMHIIRRAKEV